MPGRTQRRRGEQPGPGPVEPAYGRAAGEHGCSRFDVAFATAPSGMALLDDAGRVLEANAALLRLLARPDLDDGAWDVHLDVPCGKAVRDLLRTSRTDRTEGVLNVSLTRADGGQRWVTLHVTPLAEGDDATSLLHLEDISARMEAVALLQRRAAIDDLTELPNRAAFTDAVATTLLADDRPGIAVLFCDLDDFQSVNDALGHDAGDRVLTEVADRLAAAVRPEDVVARFEGDAFTVLCHGVTDVASCMATAERMQAALAEPVRLRGGTFHPRVSVGAAMARPGADAETLLRDAATAMSTARHSGRSRVHVAAIDDRDGPRAQRLHLEARLRKALEDETIEPWFQPLVQLRDGRTRGVEALARWRDTDGSLVSPGRFVPLAEEAGLARDLDRLVLRKACQQLAAWMTDGTVGRRFGLTVNASPRDLEDTDYAIEVHETLAATGLSPSNLTVELTERQASRRPEAFLATLRHLRAIGVNIAIDDFGVGESSLSQLAMLPVDLLKLDRAFVTQLTETGDLRGQAMLGGIVDLARSLDAVLLAEGVEEGVQLGLLRALGVELAQGWVFCPALPPHEVGPLLATSFDLDDLVARDAGPLEPPEGFEEPGDWMPMAA